ncbi:MAG: hypothetical protein HOG49_06220 [Candidatus Scalindua sp.]|jgi:hypothetical protein|nr:hypothetical protein [Candidatus Scalindua sp.]
MAANTLVHYYQCVSCDDWEILIKGKTGVYHVVYGRVPRGRGVQHDYSCDCKGFKFRKTCKHIEEAKTKHCCWMQHIDGGDIVNDCCPKCGANVRSVPHRI